jgi:hypothetical protein
MKGDFSRDTFNPANRFSRVLMQQGRVQLDADWNEQASILLHYLRSLAADLIGRHGGPQGNFGFGVVDVAALSAEERKRLEDAKILPLAHGDFLIGRGHYYVDGILCENDDYMVYGAQLDNPLPNETQPKNLKGAYVVYLDVWERHLTYLEVEDADGARVSFREVALNGPDTTTRAQVVGQVKARASNISVADAKDYAKFLAALGDEGRPGTGLLKARAIQPTADSENPCIIPPEARYRGAENRLYRVEVHLSGVASRPGAAIGGPTATFKWSRENGSVIFPIRQIAGKQVTLETLGRDMRLGLQSGDWVEIVDDDYALQNRAEPLLQIDTVAYDDNAVVLKDAATSQAGRDPSKHPILRRWDRRASDDNAPTSAGIPIVETGSSQNWIELEDGIQIQFQTSATAEPNYYRSGDYWLIPVRTATGDVEWPGAAGAPIALGPRGVVHHYAPLWIITVTAGGEVNAPVANDLRHKIALL